MNFHYFLWQLTSAVQAQISKREKRFPLLKLPRVVLLECIENMDVFEIILFSLLSKRAKSIAKRICWYILDIHLTSEGDPQIWLKLPTHPGLDFVIDYNKQYESFAYPGFQSSLKGPSAVHYLVLHDNGNCIEDMKQMMEHICEVFRSPISDIRIFEESLIEWIIKFQPTIGHLWIRDGIISSVNTLDRIFKYLKVTEHFGLQSTPIDKQFQIAEPIPARSIFVRNSFWLTLPSILNGTNSHILVYDSKLTSKDINTILKEWQKGSKLRNLELLEIEFVQDRNSYSELLDGLKWTESDGNDGRPTTVEIGDEWTITLPEVQTECNLIRSDGMIGTFFENSEVWIGGELKTCFNFQVWRRQT